MLKALSPQIKKTKIKKNTELQLKFNHWIRQKTDQTIQQKRRQSSSRYCCKSCHNFSQKIFRNMQDLFLAV